jgi:hypothetical protein
VCIGCFVIIFVSFNVFPNFERLQLRRKAGNVVTELATAVTTLVTVLVDKAGCTGSLLPGCRCRVYNVYSKGFKGFKDLKGLKGLEVWVLVGVEGLGLTV